LPKGMTLEADAMASNLDTVPVVFSAAPDAPVAGGLFDLRAKLNDPKQIGEYRTTNTPGGNDQGAGDYTIHNNFLVGTTLYTSWYTDGIRVIDVANPRAPKEVAYFVPPATTNPVKPSQRAVLTNTTQVWGSVVDEATGLVYASDMNSGLWILRRTG